VKTDKIYLVGFMAAGKTSVARALGQRLSWRVCDVDEAIETRERRTVAEIFARDGEAYFRAIERDVLFGLLPLRPAVVATGGGTFVDPQTRAAINADGVSIWLDVPIETLIARLPADGRRPLAATREQFEHLFLMRQVAYQQAHLRLDASVDPTGALVERILDWLER
jgi:shikimate kinase